MLAACGSSPRGGDAAPSADGPTTTGTGVSADEAAAATDGNGQSTAPPAAKTGSASSAAGASARPAPAPAPAAPPGPSGGSTSPGRLVEVTGFGSNPGNLRMFEHIPGGLGSGRPLVVVLHGCTQNAAGFDNESGWAALAERLRFALVLPEQPSANNGSQCWNFFLPNGNTRGGGEPASIKQMVDWEIAHRGVDPNRVYVTGLSAGAAMTNVMLATYPDVFKAGAPVAGVAFKCATNAAETVPCNQGATTKSPQEWGDLVRGATSWKGPWPRVSVWHGTDDATVSVKAMPEIVKQWTNVHGIDQSADTTDTVAGYPHAVYRDAAGTALVETFTITGMGHGQPIDPNASPACGASAPYFLDAGICAASHIAAWFGLDA